ncbi:efflux transporter, RND family, MFP subunit [Thermodesulfobium narugense DSM 14796]|uniref:Efflux transporter, RND family, MFP subunit n=1 Tax=Thermodesulfobium narugense DSM 14796 TaxID=747365 RepID=M1E7Q1_9BACT|nr:efflux RND transporter periplasmic adaptor subunit [Thermodesulfobium narugense]AEE14743.1 efflux transporter, RND family, MFP subunit [Thermodesulfobium narugense DSM 14796]
MLKNMLKNISKRKVLIASLVIGILIVLGLTLSLLNKRNTPVSQMPVVKAMKVIVRDTDVYQDYVGQVEAVNDVQIRAKVSGNIVAKYIKGGEVVKKGQPLFQIDKRTYEAAVLQAKAQLAQAIANYENAKLDADRYKILAAQDAVPQQTSDTATSIAKQDYQIVEAMRANLKQAEDNLSDTLIVAPFSGKLGVGDDLSLGAFVTAGQTVLCTLSSPDPMYVLFSISENDYLNMIKNGIDPINSDVGKNVKLVLSDGTTYKYPGKITEINRGLTQNTGTLSIKALFPNPDNILVPGMFAKVVLLEGHLKNAILVPQMAVQQILDKTFVTIVDSNNKAQMIPVKMGPRIGSLWVVEEGLKPGDNVIVEGFQKAPTGTTVKVIEVTPESLGIK